MKKQFLGLVGAFALFALAKPASAVIVIDFGTSDAGTGGTITCLNAGCTQVKGTGIVVDSMTVVGAGIFSGNYDVFGTVTGSSEGSVGSLDFNTSTNTLTITGGVCTLATPNCNGGAGTLLASTILETGSFTSFNVTSSPFFANFSGSGPDIKNPALLTALGIAPDAPFNFFLFTSGFDLNPPFGSPYTAVSTDTTNTSNAAPEPASVFLLGTVLFGAAQILRRRNARKANLGFAS